MPRRTWPVLAAVAVGLAGCALTAASATASGSPPPYVDDGPLTVREVHQELGLTFDVPPRSPPGLISAEQAYEVCRTATVPCSPGRTVRIALALATTAAAGTARPDGSIAPLLDRTLAYVVRVSGYECVPVGRPPGAPAPSLRPCEGANVVDAHTGTVLYSVEGPDLWR